MKHYSVYHCIIPDTRHPGPYHLDCTAKRHEGLGQQETWQWLPLGLCLKLTLM